MKVRLSIYVPDWPDGFDEVLNILKPQTAWTWGWQGDEPFTWIPVDPSAEWMLCQRLVNAVTEHKIYLWLDPNYQNINHAIWIAEKSLEHPICGMYLNDFYYLIENGTITLQRWKELISTVRSINPNLPICAAYYPDQWGGKTKPYNFDFDEIYFALHDSDWTDQADDELTYCENKFPNIPIWAGIYVPNGHAANIFTPEQFRRVLTVYRRHFEAGKIVGVRIFDSSGLTNHPEYVQIAKEVLKQEVLTHVLVVTSTPIGRAITVDGEAYTTPTAPLTLEEGTHVIVAPSNVTINGDVYNFVQWEDGSTNPSRTINLVGDMTISFSMELAAPPPPAKGYLQIHAFLNNQELVVPYEIAGVTVGNTPDKVELDVGTYTITVTHNTQTKIQTVEVLEGQTIRVDFQFAAPKPPIIQTIAPFIFGGMLIGLAEGAK